MSPDARKLLDYYRGLSEGRQAALLEFAEYLASKEDASTQQNVPSVPVDIPRPENESVIKAVRRLRETYPMLDQDKIFGEVSTQMTKHVIHGVASVEIIDELEVIFRRHYEIHTGGKTPTPALEDNSSS